MVIRVHLPQGAPREILVANGADFSINSAFLDLAQHVSRSIGMVSSAALALLGQLQPPRHVLFGGLHGAGHHADAIVGIHIRPASKHVVLSPPFSNGIRVVSSAASLLCNTNAWCDDDNRRMGDFACTMRRYSR